MYAVLERQLIDPFAKFATNQIMTSLVRNKIVMNPILTPLCPYPLYRYITNSGSTDTSKKVCQVPVTFFVFENKVSLYFENMINVETAVSSLVRFKIGLCGIVFISNSS